MDEKLTAIERLEAMLNEKDAQLEEMREKVQAAEEEAARNHRWTAHIKSDADPFPQLPIPRLEIRWTDIPAHEQVDGYTVLIRYDLVMRHLLGHVVRIPIGGTRTDTHSGIFQGRVDLPFRDGAHIMHDAAHLGLPAYAIAGDQIDRLTGDGYEGQRQRGIAHRSPTT